MKKIALIIFALLLGITLISCDETTTDPIIEEEIGNLQINSTPSGATITLDGENTQQVTPFMFAGRDAGTYVVKLQLAGYLDTTITTEIIKDQTTTLDITLAPVVEYFSTPVKIWETTGTDATQPSGLDLSSGDAFGTSDATNNDKIDLYYFSSSDGSTFLVQSAHLNANMTRETFFKVAAASDIEDGADSDVKDGTWVDSMSDREANYVFLYDEDGHYSKLKIVNFGGGTGPGDPSWVEVAWYYNTVSESVVF